MGHVLKLLGAENTFKLIFFLCGFDSGLSADTKKKKKDISLIYGLHIDCNSFDVVFLFSKASPLLVLLPFDSESFCEQLVSSPEF